MTSHQETKPTLDEVIENLGFGPFQIMTGIVGGGVWLADGAELLLISCVTMAVSLEWNLSPVARASIVTIVFFGIMLGNLLSGPIGDNFGRRHVIVLSYGSMFVFSLLSSYSRCFFELALIRLLVGASIGIGQPAWTTMSVEVTPMWWRVPMNVCSQMLFVVGELYSGCLLIADDPELKDMHWRWLLRMGAMPSALFMIASFLFLEQSPKYLAAVGQHDDAVGVLNTMKSFNRMHTISTAFIAPLKAVQCPFMENLRKQREIVFGNNLMLPTCVLLLTCFTLNLVYYGCLYAFPQILPKLIISNASAGSELFVGALWELPGFASGLIIGTLLPRKLGLRIYLLLVILATTSFLFGSFVAEWHYAATAAIFGGYYGIKCFVSIGFILVYQCSAEIYPIEARTTGAGITFAGGRLASMISPLLYEFLANTFHSFNMFFVLILGFCCLNFILIGALPFGHDGTRLPSSEGSLTIGPEKKGAK